MSEVVELSMVMVLLPPQRQPISSGCPHIFFPMSFAFQLASFNIMNLLSLGFFDHLFSRLNSLWVDPETKGADRESLVHASTEDVKNPVYHFSQW